MLTLSWPPRRVWACAVVGFALAAAAAAATVRDGVFNLPPEDYSKSVGRFDGGVRDVEVDPRPPWARIPRILPGPADSWAGGTPHALRLALGRRSVRPLVLYLDVEAGREAPPSRLAVAVNGATVTTVATRSGGSALSPELERPVRLRHRIAIPSTALGDGADVRLTITNDAGPAVAWQRLRLVDDRPTPAWSHLRRHGPLPRESAAFLAASLATLLVWSAGGSAGESWLWRVLRASGPASAVILLGAAAAMPRDSLAFAGVPRWLWLLAPWVLLLFRPRGRGARITTRSLLVNTALALVTFAICLLIAELGLRAVFGNVESAGDERTYFHRERPATLNSHGFREREFQLRKPENTYRIALIGDSFTKDGPLMARVSNRLEGYLNANRRSGLVYEVLNFGKSGADTVDELRLLQRLVLDTNPDFVLLQWYVNDFENHDHSSRPTAYRLIQSAALRRRLLRSSALYSLLEPQWTFLQEKLELTDSYEEYMYRRFGDPEGPDSTYAMERLKEFFDVCRQRKIPLGVVLFPRVIPGLSRGAYEYDFLHDRVLEACRREQVTCVDLRAPFAAYTNYRDLWITPLNGHPSPLANRIAAERLIEALGQMWLGTHLKAQNH